MAEGQNTAGAEVTNPLLGSIKVFGMDSNMINLLFTILAFGGIVGVCFMLFTHTTDAKDIGKDVAKELKESNKEIAITLKESNKELAAVLRELAQASREQNCLLSMPPEKRAENAELCKRISR